MSDDYVRKDFYDEGIKRIEAMMAASKAENKASEARFRQYAERVLARFERDTEYLAGHIADIKEKQAEYERRHDRFINYIGIVITLCGAVVAIAQLYIALKG